MSTINTNVQSLNAQRNLATSAGSLSTSMQRLSSGLRINSAKDDAAGLAISERMNAQVKGLNVAARNANDGISLAQTAEGALGKVSDMLQRIRELAVQSTNASNSQTDRDALQGEANQLRQEVDRVATQTNFNSTKLLDGQFANKSFQVGANQGETIDIKTIANAQSTALGNWTDVGAKALVTGIAADGGAVASATGNSVLAAGAGGSATTVPGTSVQSTATTTLTAGPGGPSLAFTVAGATPGAADFATELLALGFTDTGAATVGTEAGNSGFTLNLSAGATSIADAISTGSISFSRADGVEFDVVETQAGDSYTAGSEPSLGLAGTTANGTEAAFTAIAAGQLTINGTNITVGAAASADERMRTLAASINSNVAGVFASVDSNNQLSLSSPEDIVIAGSATNASILDQTGLVGGATLTATTSAGLGVAKTGFSDVDISTVDGANNMIRAMDAALQAVNSSRGELGAVQSRFENAIGNINVTAENTSAARARIVDADFAKETANLSRAQILQQAGTAMVAQANQLPQGVLALLR